MIVKRLLDLARVRCKILALGGSRDEAPAREWYREDVPLFGMTLLCYHALLKSTGRAIRALLRAHPELLEEECGRALLTTARSLESWLHSAGDLEGP